MGGKATVSGRGRKPKPKALRKLSGNAGKRPINENEPEFSDIKNIDPPDWLGERATQMWQRVVPELLREKIICITDLHLVESFCMAYEHLRDAQDQIDKFGVIMQNSSGGPIKNPAYTAFNEANSQMMKLGAALGLSPADRTRLIGGKKVSNSNQFLDLING